METSPSTEKLDEALAKAQGEFKPAIKDSTNPHFQSKFAGLSSIWDACRPVLAKYEISVTQWPTESSDGRIHLVTRIAHKGEWIKSSFSVPVMKQDPQGYGSGITYIKRYALSAALGIVGDEDDEGDDTDDDGNAASGKSEPRVPSLPYEDHPQDRDNGPALMQAMGLSKPGVISEKQGKRLWAISKNANWDKVDLKDYLFLKAAISSIHDVPRDQYTNICNYIEKNPKIK